MSKVPNIIRAKRPPPEHERKVGDIWIELLGGDLEFHWRWDGYIYQHVKDNLEIIAPFINDKERQDDNKAEC